jgi:hypothetical protein
VYPSYELPPQREQPIQNIPSSQAQHKAAHQISDKMGFKLAIHLVTVLALKCARLKVLLAQQTQGNQTGRSGNSANLVNQANSGKDDILG